MSHRSVLREFYLSDRPPVELEEYRASYQRTRLVAGGSVIPMSLIMIKRVEHAHIAVPILIALSLLVLAHARFRRHATLHQMSIVDTTAYIAMALALDVPEVVLMVVMAQAYIIFFFLPARKALATTIAYALGGLGAMSFGIAVEWQQRAPDEVILIVVLIALLTISPATWTLFRSGAEMHRRRKHEQLLEEEKDRLLADLQQTLNELSATQAELVSSQKLEAIGSLAAGVAHEINTPIQYIGDNTRFAEDSLESLLKVARAAQALVESMPDSPELEEIRGATQAADLAFLAEELPDAMSESLDGLDQVSRLVQALKSFSHPGTDDKTPTDINELVTTTVAVSRNEWKYVAHIDLAGLDTELPHVPALAGPLKQVILNTIVNAAHAIAPVFEKTGDKGTISIRTSVVCGNALIAISDTGTGIPVEVRDRILEPFFTTKEIGRGTGQGLAIAHSIAEKHDGALTFETEVGQGTTFTISLPLEATGEVAVEEALALTAS